MKLARLNGGAEIFYSIQGEGKNSGTPSLFVRLALCNLACVWCDSDYTWNWKKFKKSEQVIEMSVPEIAVAIQKHRCKNIVLTGGEPLLQQKELVGLMALLKNKNYFFEIETNATLLPSKELDGLVDQYNCSPKLKNSGNRMAKSLCKKTLEFFAKNPKATFKFVMKRPEDLKEMEKFVATFKIPREKIYLMPEGKTSKTIREKEPWLVEICKARGFHFTDRLHIHLYGDRRGV